MKKLSNEEAQNVLDNAPEGFTHYCENTSGDIFYFNPDNLNAYIPWTSDCIELGTGHYASSRSKPLSDLRDQLNQHGCCMRKEMIGERDCGTEAAAMRIHEAANAAFFSGKKMGAPADVGWEFADEDIRRMWRAVVELTGYAVGRNQHEWKNGDECRKSPFDDTFYFVGKTPVADSNFHGDCMIQHEGGAPINAFMSDLSRPESPEEKAAAERQARIKHWRDMHNRLAREDFFAYLADNVEVE